MAESTAGETILVQPKTKNLSATELVAQHSANKMEQNQENKELTDLEVLYAQLSLSIAAPRIERLNGRCLARWNAQKCLVQVIRKEGKFEHFGRYINNSLFLDYYEALYLLELGRLQLEHYGITLSIEQAYLLLLGEAASPKFNEYLVYSSLTRAGYILMRHRNKVYTKCLNTEPTEKDCVWAWLLNELGNRTLPNYIKKTEMYAKVKKQIENNKATIIEQEAYEQKDEEKDVVEQKPDIELPGCSVPKKSKIELEENSIEAWPAVEEAKSLLDFLKNEPEFKQFEMMFQKFDIINLKSAKSTNNNSGNSSDNDEMEVTPCKRYLRINFDLYLRNNGFKKSTPFPPAMRIIIVDTKQAFPNHTEITKICRSLLHNTPILIVSVGDAKQIQAFLYVFS